MRPIIIGEGPSRSGDRYHQFPLSGQVGKRLCTWAGIEPLERNRFMTSDYARYYWALHDRFELHNFFDRFPQDWSPRVTAPMFREDWDPVLYDRVVVLLGVRVQTVFRYAAFTRGSEFFRWEKCGGFEGRRCWVVTVPHPSGLNRLYNSKDVEEQTGKVLRRAMTLGEQWDAAKKP